MKQFTYKNEKTGKILFEIVGPNYWDNLDADAVLLKEKKINIISTPHIIREIKAVKAAKTA